MVCHCVVIFVSLCLMSPSNDFATLLSSSLMTLLSFVVQACVVTWLDYTAARLCLFLPGSVWEWDRGLWWWEEINWKSIYFLQHTWHCVLFAFRPVVVWSQSEWSEWVAVIPTQVTGCQASCSLMLNFPHRRSARLRFVMLCAAALVAPSRGHGAHRQQKNTMRLSFFLSS